MDKGSKQIEFSEEKKGHKHCRQNFLNHIIRNATILYVYCNLSKNIWLIYLAIGFLLKESVPYWKLENSKSIQTRSDFFQPRPTISFLESLILLWVCNLFIVPDGGPLFVLFIVMLSKRAWMAVALRHAETSKRLLWVIFAE